MKVTTCRASNWSKQFALLSSRGNRQHSPSIKLLNKNRGAQQQAKPRSSASPFLYPHNILRTLQEAFVGTRERPGSVLYDELCASSNLSELDFLKEKKKGSPWGNWLASLFCKSSAHPTPTQIPNRRFEIYTLKYDVFILTKTDNEKKRCI